MKLHWPSPGLVVGMLALIVATSGSAVAASVITSKGAMGDPGMPGATHVVVRTQSFGAIPSGTHVVVRPMCEAGERAAGGEAGFAEYVGSGQLQQSYPAKADASRATAGDIPAGRWWGNQEQLWLAVGSHRLRRLGTALAVGVGRRRSLC